MHRKIYVTVAHTVESTFEYELDENQWDEQLIDTLEEVADLKFEECYNHEHYSMRKIIPVPSVRLNLEKPSS